jgi:hypothetical protein
MAWTKTGNIKGPKGDPGPVVPLDGLVDVNVSGATHGQALTFDETLSEWQANDIGLEGPQGPPGPQGPEGPPGEGLPGPQSFAQVNTTEPAPRAVGDLWVDPDDHVLDWDADWRYPTLLNGYTDANVSTSGRLRYRKLPGGMVHITGRLSGTTSTGSAQIATNLPVGYRPPFTAPGSGLSTAASSLGWYEVRTDGNLAILGPTGAATTWMINITYWAG